MAYDITVPGGYARSLTTFTAAAATSAKVLLEPLQVGGGGNVPVDARFLGGGRAVDILISSSDSVAKDFRFWHGKVTTTISGTEGATSITGTNTITATTGDFRTKYRVGDLVMVFSAQTAVPLTSEGLLGIVTSVTATTIACNTPTAWTNESLPAGTRIVKVSPELIAPVAANAGVSTTANVNLIGSAGTSAQDNTGTYLASDEMLIGNVQSTLSAVPAYLSVNVIAAAF